MVSLRLVVFLLCDSVNVLDVTGPLEVFSQSCRMLESGPLPYRILVVSMAGGAVRTSAGLSVLTESVSVLDTLLDTRDGVGSGIDTLIVPGGGPSYHPFAPQPMVDWIAAMAPRVRRLCSVCTGAFALATAGLLAHRRATTHWQAGDTLRKVEPRVCLEPDAIYVCDGKLWTSAGVSAGIDLALALVEADLGHAQAMQVARRMVVFLKRPGGQSQFSVPLIQQTANDSFSALHAWMASHLHEELSVVRLAEQVNMTARTFARSYTALVQRTPARSVEAMRLEAACGLLEGSDKPFKRIAAECGLGSEQNLRRAFVRKFGVTPNDYRARFAAKRVLLPLTEYSA